MATALAALANATAAFVVPGAGVISDPDTGNVVPVQQTLNVALFLKVAAVETSPYPGVDTGATVYEGYVVDPGLLDAAVVKGTLGTLVFAGQREVQCRVLEARMPYGSLGVLGATLAKTLGDRIKLITKEQV